MLIPLSPQAMAMENFYPSFIGFMTPQYMFILKKPQLL